jgi:hypothetical protein
MKKASVVLILLWSAQAMAAPCVEQNYSDPKAPPDFSCPGPGESVMVPEIDTRPSKGLPKGTEIKLADRLIKLDYDAVLMSRNKTLELGLKIKGIRRLRWLELHRAKDLMTIERKYVSDRYQSQLDLEKIRTKTAVSQRDQAREQRDTARAWYRSWTFGLIVGVVITTAAAGTIAYIAK